MINSLVVRLKKIRRYLNACKICLKTEGVDFFRTYYLNLHYFPIKQALLLPIFIYHNTLFTSMNGKIIIESLLSTGIFHFGRLCLGIQDIKYSRSIWDVAGTIVIKGDVTFGRGSKLSIGQDAYFEVGNNVAASGMSEFICHKQIILGNNCHLGWNLLIMDIDFHKIYDKDNSLLNAPKPIRIGNHIWIGCRVTIFKGVSISDNNVIAANSVITKDIQCKNCVITSSGKELIILKQDITWKE